jgi:hypothetical protein
VPGRRYRHPTGIGPSSGCAFGAGAARSVPPTSPPEPHPGDITILGPIMAFWGRQLSERRPLPAAVNHIRREERRNGPMGDSVTKVEEAIAEHRPSRFPSEE